MNESEQPAQAELALPTENTNENEQAQEAQPQSTDQAVQAETTEQTGTTGQPEQSENQEQAAEPATEQRPEQTDQAVPADEDSNGKDSDDDAEKAPAERSQREILAEELQNITAKAAVNSLLFFSPNLDEISEKVRAEREAQREAEEAERRARRLAELTHDEDEVTSRRRRRRRRGETDIEIDGGAEDDPENTVIKVRTPRISDSHTSDRVTGVRGSTRLEAKRMRRRESRQGGRRSRGISEAEFLARRESVDRQMIVRQKDDRVQIGVLEDGVLAEHFVSKTQQDSLIGNVYLGKVQNVLPSMEAAFVDIGRGRNAVLYAGEVNWDVSGLDGAPRKIENALKSGDSVLVQVTKDPVGHKGARLTSQVSLPGRFLVYVPGGSMTGISRKLPDTERARLKKILKDKLPEGAGVIVRTAAEGASEDELTHDINRLRAQWEEIQSLAEAPKTLAPEMLYQEPDLTIKTVRDVFNEDFSSMIVQDDAAWDSIEAYVTYMAPDLVDRLQKWESEEDLFEHYRIEEQLQKALDRKVYLPSGGSLVIDRTEAMTVVDVNTGKFTGSGGNLEETVTKNNLEAAEEIVRQLRLRDIGGIIVIDFIDMVLESNRDLVLRRLIECLGRDRTKHQVAEVTSLGLVQMTRKRMGTGLLEVFSELCESCAGRGVVVHDQPLKGRAGGSSDFFSRHDREDRRKARKQQRNRDVIRHDEQGDEEEQHRNESRRTAFANIAAASTHDEEDSNQESKNARKRKRRKKNRRENNGGDNFVQENAQQQNDSAQERSERVVTIGGEPIEVPEPTRDAEETSESSMGEQGSFTLESLEEVFDKKSEKKSRTRSKKREQVRGEDLTENSDASAGEDTVLDSRFTQNSARLEAIRAGEARARASQKAGRDLSSREDEGNASGESKRDARSGTREERGSRDRRRSEGNTSQRRPRRASSAQQVAGHSNGAEKPQVSGVAQPGSVMGEQEEKVTETILANSAEQPATTKAPARKRKSRRAVSTGVEGSVKSETISSSEAAATVVASTAQAAKPAEDSGSAVMLGVGVSASEIKRAGQ
ncbi:Rne/Rng family ribonuclease [Rothia sp. LK2588]|uniref:Rne/Rng family ribonuclease n=1 Tax=Rothia sp. LK2588 TaxID=3114369 RepID=UPI0034CE039E